MLLFVFILINSLIKHTQLFLGLGCANDGAPNSNLFALSRTPIRTKYSTYFLIISLCNFGTGYGLEHVGFASSFDSDSTGSVL